MKGKSPRYLQSFAVILTVSVLFLGGIHSRAEGYGYHRSRDFNPYEEDYSYQDSDEDYWNDDYEYSGNDYDDVESYDDYNDYEGYDEGYSDDITMEEPEEIAVPGTYTVAAGWSVDEAQSSESTTVYRQDAFSDAETTSLISCSYLDTNYSRSEYEQLRDMLTNNLLYDNVNAQISTSAIYTDAKDYLYIIVVDDPNESALDIYHYVVGDYLCFCVQVKEVREEAAEDESADRQTPQQAGLSMAQSFTWN